MVMHIHHHHKPNPPSGWKSGLVATILLAVFGVLAFSLRLQGLEVVLGWALLGLAGLSAVLTVIAKLTR